MSTVTELQCYFGEYRKQENAAADPLSWQIRKFLKTIFENFKVTKFFY